MSTATKYIVAGKIGATHGVHGWLKLISFTQPLSQILSYETWHLEKGAHQQIIKVEASRGHAKGIIVKFCDYNSPEQARQLTGGKITILRTQLPRLKKGDYYWSDLEGLTVINKDKTMLGKVIYLLETGSNDVLVVKGDTELAIPYLPTVIKQIDLANQTLYVDWELI